MARFLSFPAFLGGIGVAALIALGIRAMSDLPFWACFLIAVFSVLINGWIATWEDEQPRGFNDPKDQN